MYLSAVLIKIYFYFMSVNVSALHVWLVHTEARRGCWILTEVTGDCESQFGCWELNLVLCKSKSILNCLTGAIFSVPLSSFLVLKFILVFRLHSVMLYIYAVYIVHYIVHVMFLFSKVNLSFYYHE